MTDLTDEVVEVVLAKVRAGDVPDDIAVAAAAEQPITPTITAWVDSLIRDIGATDELELERRLERDELVQRRIEPVAQRVVQRIVELMIRREFGRRVAAGEVIARIGADGETYYERAGD